MIRKDEALFLNLRGGESRQHWAQQSGMFRFQIWRRIFGSWVRGILVVVLTLIILVHITSFICRKPGKLAFVAPHARRLLRLVLRGMMHCGCRMDQHPIDQCLGAQRHAQLLRQFHCVRYSSAEDVIDAGEVKRLQCGATG